MSVILSAIATPIIIGFLVNASATEKFLVKLGKGATGGVRSFVRNLREKDGKGKEGEVPAKPEREPAMAGAAAGPAPSREAASGTTAAGWPVAPGREEAAPVPPRAPEVESTMLMPVVSLEKGGPDADLESADTAVLAAPEGAGDLEDTPTLPVRRQQEHQVMSPAEAHTVAEDIARGPQQWTQPEISPAYSEGDLVPTAAEEKYIARLEGDAWKASHAYRSVFQNLVPHDVRLTQSGVVFAFPLEGTKWTPSALADRVENLRVALDVAKGTEVRIYEGETGSFVEVAIRSRRVTDRMDMMWKPGTKSIGVDTVTGEEVFVPAHDRVLLAGASGSGKSWSMRPLMMRDVEDPDTEPILLDGKGDEANVWAGVIECAVEPFEIIEAIDELHDDMFRRKRKMQLEGVSVWNLAHGPRRTVYVDEGRVILAIINNHDKAMKTFKGDEDALPETPRLQKLIDLSSLGRSREIVLNWATQYPVTSGQNPGIDPQININVDARFCLRVKTLTQARIVLDDDAYYGPHNIPNRNEEWDTRGHGYKGDYKENLIRTWTVTDEMIIARRPENKVSQPEISLPVADPFRKLADPQEPVVEAEESFEEEESAVEAAVEAVEAVEQEEEASQVEQVDGLAPADITRIIVRTANSFYRRAERAGQPVSRRELQQSTDGRYRRQIPNLVDEAIRYCMEEPMLGQTEDGLYFALRRDDE